MCINVAGPVIEMMCDTPILMANQSDTITILCNVVATPPPTVQWFKDDTPIENILSNDSFIIRDSGMELELINVVVSYGGRYRCDANNAEGSSSYTVLLDILSKCTIMQTKTSMLYKHVHCITLECIHSCSKCVHSNSNCLCINIIIHVQLYVSAFYYVHCVICHIHGVKLVSQNRGVNYNKKSSILV